MAETGLLSDINGFARCTHYYHRKP